MTTSKVINIIIFIPLMQKGFDTYASKMKPSIINLKLFFYSVWEFTLWQLDPYNWVLEVQHIMMFFLKKDFIMKLRE